MQRCWPILASALLCSGSLLNDEIISLVRPRWTTREFSPVLNISPIDPFSADQERAHVRAQVDSLGPWTIEYSNPSRKIIPVERYNHDSKFNHEWYMGLVSFRDEISPQRLWAAQAFDKVHNLPVIVNQRASIEFDTVQNISAVYKKLETDKTYDLFPPTEILKSTSEFERVIADASRPELQREIDLPNFIVVEEDLAFIKHWWPLSRVLGELVIEMFGSDLFKIMTPKTDDRDFEIKSETLGCGISDYLPPPSLDLAVSSVLALFIEAISASVRSVLDLHAKGVNHCLLNFDTLLVKNTNDFVNLYFNRSVASFAESEEEFTVPTIPKFELIFRFVGNANSGDCLNQLRKNTHRYEEHTPLAHRSFARSTIPEKYLRLHHDDNVSLLSEVVTFTELIGLHVTQQSRDHLSEMPSVRRLNMFMQLTQSTLREIDPYSGKATTSPRLTDSELIDWFTIAQQMLRPSVSEDQPGEEAPGITDRLYRDREDDLSSIEKLISFNETWPWTQPHLRGEISLALEPAASLYHRRFLEYKNEHIPQLELEHWYPIAPYSKEFMTEYEIQSDQFIYGGHSVLTKGTIRRDPDNTILDENFIPICDLAVPKNNSKVIVKVALYNPRYPLACFTRMVRADVSGHRRCFKELFSVKDLVCNHFIPPEAHKHLAVSYEQLYEGPNAQEAFTNLLVQLSSDPDQSTENAHRYIKVAYKLAERLFKRAVEFWTLEVFHQDMTAANIVLYPQETVDRCLTDLSVKACEQMTVTIVDWGYSMRFGVGRLDRRCNDCTTLGNDILRNLDEFRPFGIESMEYEKVKSLIDQFTASLYKEAQSRAKAVIEVFERLAE